MSDLAQPAPSDGLTARQLARTASLVLWNREAPGYYVSSIHRSCRLLVLVSANSAKDVAQMERLFAVICAVVFTGPSAYYKLQAPVHTPLRAASPNAIEANITETYKKVSLASPWSSALDAAASAWNSKPVNGTVATSTSTGIPVDVAGMQALY